MLRSITILLVGLTSLSATSCIEQPKTKKRAQQEQKSIPAIAQKTQPAKLAIVKPQTKQASAAVAVSNPHEQKQIWHALADSFHLTNEINHPDVDKHVQKLLQNKAQLQKLMEYSAPYLHYVLNEVKQRGLPGELALIPIVESAFNPFAKSHVGAVGLWQLMPATSTDLGVTRDWWFDGRRDIQQSTKASLQYFDYLKKFFKGDWSHAIAAYNAGQGRVRSAINKNISNNKDTSYWTLPLPKETKDYVPKLYALVKIIKEPARYNVKLPSILNQPYFKFVKVDATIELAKAAKLANMDLKEFQVLNPGHKQWLTKPEMAHKIAVPVHKVDAFKQNLRKVSEEKKGLMQWKGHVVKKGDSIQKIAKTYKAPKELLTQVNQISAKVKPGETVWIPQRSMMVAA